MPASSDKMRATAEEDRAAARIERRGQQQRADAGYTRQPDRVDQPVGQTAEHETAPRARHAIASPARTTSPPMIDGRKMLPNRP